MQSSCHAFSDPYVEHDTLTLWIDLILLKRDVYRHLLFNRGTGARKLGTASKTQPNGDMDGRSGGSVVEIQQLENIERSREKA